MQGLVDYSSSDDDDTGGRSRSRSPVAPAARPQCLPSAADALAGLGGPPPPSTSTVVCSKRPADEAAGGRAKAARGAGGAVVGGAAARGRVAGALVPPQLRGR